MNVYLPNKRLPTEYQEVEYIENNGTAYFKVGLNIRDGYKFVGKIRSLQNENMDGGALTGGYIGNSGNIYYRLYVGAIRNGRWSYGYLEHFSNGDTGSGALNTDYTVEYSWISGNAYFKVNNTTYFTYTSTYSTDKVGEVPLLAGYGDGYGYYANPGIRLYYAQYYDKNGNLVRDLVPCYRKSDGVIGVYDLVNSVFYTNAGTGTFSKGNDVTMTELKNDYIGEYKGWTPGSNTLFYSNWDNGTVTAKVGTITNYGGTITQQYGTNVLYISGTNVTRIDSPILYYKGTGNYHYNVWIKVGTSGFNAINYNNGYSQITIVQEISGTIYAGVVEANIGFGSGYSFNSTIGVFHNVAINYLGGGTCDVYIDGVFKGTSTNTQTGYGNTGSGQWFGVDRSQYSTGNGYIGANIVENKARTAQEISDYYNQTKSNYGL